MDSAAIRNAVCVVGNCTAFGLFLSPLPTFLTIMKKDGVEKFSPVPYLAMLMNCVLWFFYGILNSNSILIVTVNGAGIMFAAIYLTIFLAYSDAKQRVNIVKFIFAELAFAAAAVAVVLLTASTHEQRSAMVGVLCIIFGTCMSASPLSVLKLVIKTKSVKYMPFTLSFIIFVNSISWTAYALLKFNLYITIPNAIGTLLGLVQLVIYGIYYKSTPHSGDDAGDDVEMYD